MRDLDFKTGYYKTKGCYVYVDANHAFGHKHVIFYGRGGTDEQNKKLLDESKRRRPMGFDCFKGAIIFLYTFNQVSV